MKTLILLISMITMTLAAPAIPGDINFKQSDGSLFTGTLHGDEWFLWVEDKKGNTIKYNSNSKNYEYAFIEEENGKTELVLSGVKVKKQTKLSDHFTPSQIKKIKVDKKKFSEIAKRKRDKALRR